MKQCHFDGDLKGNPSELHELWKWGEHSRQREKYMRRSQNGEEPRMFEELQEGRWCSRLKAEKVFGVVGRGQSTQVLSTRFRIYPNKKGKQSC